MKNNKAPLKVKVRIKTKTRPCEKDSQKIKQGETSPIMPNDIKPIRKHTKAIVTTLIITLALILLFISGYYTFRLLSQKQAIVLSAEEIYSLASPATVEIRVETKYGTATGTGFFDSSDGTIVTNFHVVDGATSGTVFLGNGEKYKILKLIGYDRDLDIAIIQINYQPTHVLTKRTDLLQTGETVYAIGSSLGLTDSFSQGIISANQREIDGQIYLQTTTPISHGNSGGPLIDGNGNIVGITTAGLETGQNINLAIPIEKVSQIDRSIPVNFPNNLSCTEQSAITNAGISYWEWIDIRWKSMVVCDTEDLKYHNGHCFVVNLVRYREECKPDEAKADKFIFLFLDDALKQGYTQCQNCKLHNITD